jgi:hypothetical protein
VHSLDDRRLIGSLDHEFARLHSGYGSLIGATPEHSLYSAPSTSTGHSTASVGEHVLRGVAVVEQTFGGLTANLWDDPFEWTLPEQLSTASRILDYLDEVEATRRYAFGGFNCDRELFKEVMVPAAKSRTLLELLIATLVRASDYFGRATATLSLLADSQPPAPAD